MGEPIGEATGEATGEGEGDDSLNYCSMIKLPLPVAWGARF
jgi:hypothetical protein